MNRDISLLAQRILAGDFSACPPLVDELKDCRDHRLAEFDRLVGHVLGVMPGDPEGDMYRGGKRRYEMRTFMHEIRALFWRDLPGLSGRLEAASKIHAATGDDADESMGYEETGPAEYAPPIATGASDEEIREALRSFQERYQPMTIISGRPAVFTGRAR